MSYACEVRLGGIRKQRGLAYAREGDVDDAKVVIERKISDFCIICGRIGTDTDDGVVVIL